MHTTWSFHAPKIWVMKMTIDIPLIFHIQKHDPFQINIHTMPNFHLQKQDAM